MAPSIEIDDEVWAELQRRAVPFVDTPNSVLRGALGLHPNGDTPSGEDFSEPISPHRRSRKRRSRSKGMRAPAGSLLPETEYEDPILRALVEMGGRGPTSEVVDRVGVIIGDRLTDLDQEVLASGDVRWRNRVQFTRLKLIEEGLMAKDSPRGTWEITDDGRARVGSELR